MGWGRRSPPFFERYVTSAPVIGTEVAGENYYVRGFHLVFLKVAHPSPWVNRVWGGGVQ